MQAKKLTALLLGAALSLGLLAGCSSGAATHSQDPAGASPAVQPSGAGELSSFTADTLAGDSFTQDDISAKDVTVINFWGTYCGPCINEMPDLAAYAKTLPENVQLITVCVDGAGNPEGAERILEEAGYEGVTLLGGDENFLAVCNSVQVIPTTIFVDSGGSIVGSAVIGSQADLAAAFTDGVNQVLKAAGKAEISVEIG